VGGELVKLLWNWLTPELFGWREITFWQGLGLLVLCRMLFGGWGMHSSGRPGWRRRAQMTPEERERFRHGMHGRCGFDLPAAGGENAERPGVST
jgi:hypothetical protein